MRGAFVTGHATSTASMDSSRMLSTAPPRSATAWKASRHATASHCSLPATLRISVRSVSPLLTTTMTPRWRRAASVRLGNTATRKTACVGSSNLLPLATGAGATTLAVRSLADCTSSRFFSSASARCFLSRLASSVLGMVSKTISAFAAARSTASHATRALAKASRSALRLTSMASSSSFALLCSSTRAVRSVRIVVLYLQVQRR